jgi:hypothetical protein
MVRAVTLSKDDITRRVASLLREHGRALDVVGVASSEGGSGRIELLITIAGCHAEPCRLLINVTRASPIDFERELRAALADALASHGA